MKRIVLAACVAVLVASAGSAEAAKVGDNLYIKSKNTKMMKKPKATAKVVKVLQPGEQVKWRGAVKTRKGKTTAWHKVAFKGQKGIVYRTTLSAKQPSMEMMKSGQQVDSMAFASSGAATKALGSGAKTYGKNNNMPEAVDSLEALEKLSKTVKTNDIAKHVRKNKLAPNVGAGQ